MKRIGEHNFYIQSSNTHLLNILEDNYYMELGTISIKNLNRILNCQVLDLSQIVYFEILNNGIGKISNDQTNDLFYQLNFLLSLRQKSSSNKFFLTCGTITYFDELGNERYAPVVLIPMEIDYQNGKIIIENDPMPNRLLLKLLSKKLKETKEDQNRFIENYTNVSLSTVGQIDKYIQDLANEGSFAFTPNNLLTVCKVENYDFTITKNFFNAERSVYETTNEDIINNYFNDIKAILPTNIDQKYTILKVAHGDSFAVDGRLGSGKTYTIFNIIADQISKGKKILYVNQDLDNIWDLEKNFRILGLNNYVYNLTKNLRDIDVPKIDLPPFSKNDFAITDIASMIDFEKSLNEKTHGFSFQYVIETLAVLKNSCFNLDKLEIENILQKYEVDDVYKDLKEVEKGIKVIDKYCDNIWKALTISHNNITVEEITDRTNRFYDTHLQLNKEVEKFCHNYQLAIPKNIYDLNKFISHILSFDAIKPLAIWQNTQIRSEAAQILKEIQTLADLNYSNTRYYEHNIISSYQPGKAKELLQELAGDYIDYQAIEDTIYLDRLLAPDTKINTLIQKIKNNISLMKKHISNICDLFNIKNNAKDFNKNTFGLFDKLIKFFDNNILLNSWVKFYLNESTSFNQTGKRLKELLTIMEKERNVFDSYVVRNDLLDYEEIDNLMKNNQFARLIKKYFEKNQLKKNHTMIGDLIKAVRNYYDATKEAFSLIVDSKYDGFENAEKQIRCFIAFYDLVNSLDSKSNTILCNYLSRHTTSLKLDFSSLKILLHDFLEELIQSDSLTVALKNYKFEVKGETGYDKQVSLIKASSYLSKVLSIKHELIVIFKDRKNLDSSILYELIAIDEQYAEVQKTLKKREIKYEALLGENYRGFDTSISDMGQTLEHFDDFVARIEADADIVLLFQEPTLGKLLDGALKLRNLYSTWINDFRLFSICFKGGKTKLQEKTLKEVSKEVKGYKLTTNQIPYVLFINDFIKKANLYGLDSLCELLANATDQTCLADSFLYATLLKIYNMVITKKPYLLDFAGYENTYQQYTSFEIDYCTKNIIALRKQSEKKTKTRINNLKFNEYNHIIENLSKNISLFMADLAIFNDNLDLDIFDLVIIDDGHLSSSNKYNRLTECKQVVIFGDKSFQSSIANTLMQRVGDSCIVPYHNRYIRMSSRFNNLWTTSNRYVYNFDTVINKKKVNDLKHFAGTIVDFFNKNNNHIINVVVGNEITRRDVYANIVGFLQNNYATNEIIEILCYNIRIINASFEGSRYVNDVMIYYNDFLNFEQNQKELIFKNFVVISNSISIFYVGTKYEDQNKKILKDINTTIGNIDYQEKTLFGISDLLYKRLKLKNLKIKPGFGSFDIIIEEKNTVAVMIIGKATDEYFSLLDEYHYYYNEYQKNGWIVEVLYTGDLINHFEEHIDELIKLAKEEDK